MLLTERAAREIGEAAAWWAREHSVGEAERWYQGIREAIERLAMLPRRCPRIDEQDASTYEIRELQYGHGSAPTHRVVFAIIGERVVVLTVRHLARRPLGPEDLSR